MVFACAIFRHVTLLFVEVGWQGEGWEWCAPTSTPLWHAMIYCHLLPVATTGSPFRMVETSPWRRFGVFWWLVGHCCCHQLSRQDDSNIPNLSQ